MNKKEKLNFVLLVLVVLFFSLSGVFATGSQEKGKRAEKITLQMWDDYSGKTRDPVVKAAIEQFKKLHPNVDIQRTVRPLKDLTTMIIPALSAKKGPDMMVVNSGEQMEGPLVRGGHLVNLDPYAEKYGWTKKLLNPSLWNRVRYSEDGTVFGTGHIYGVSFDGELVGVYYNKDMFKGNGLGIPKSLDEFENVCEKLKGVGIAPIALAGLKDYRFFHLYALVQASVLSHDMGIEEAQKYLEDIVLRWKADRSFVIPGNIEAAKIIQDWVRKGYFVKGFLGLKGSDDLALFMAGKSAMFVQGSWYSTEIADSNINAGLFPFPPYKKGEPFSPQVGGATTPFGMSKYSKYKDLDAEFMNILLTSDTTVRLQKENSVLPARIPVSLKGIDKNTLYYDLLDDWNKINESGHMTFFLDWTTPTMWDTLAEGGRSLMGMKITPKEFVNKLEADYLNWQKNKPKPKK